MLQQLKDIFPEKWPLARRRPGADEDFLEALGLEAELRFSITAQKELSGKHFTVKDIRRYEFADISVQAYGLAEDKGIVCWMIVARDERSGPYIAISRQLNVRDQERMLMGDELGALRREGTEHLYAREHTTGFKGWVAMHYTRKMEKVRGKRHHGGSAKVFEYELYVSDDTTKAIEVERYLNGDTDIFVTIYLPFSDVTLLRKRAVHLHEQQEAGNAEAVEVDEGEESKILPHPGLYPSKPIEKSKEKTAVTSALEKVNGAATSNDASKSKKTAKAKEDSKAEVTAASKSAVKSQATSSEAVRKLDKATAELASRLLAVKTGKAPAAKAAKTTEDVTAANVSAQVTESMKLLATTTETIVEAKTEVTSQEVAALKVNANHSTMGHQPAKMRTGRLDCDIQTAGRLIEEALASDIKLSDVVRRVLGLPVATNEMISFTFSLSQDDYHLLAERYGAEDQDIPKIHANIVSELEGFAGTKKKKA